MSLVLEALKKLDREKGRDERGFVVMTATPWPTRAARRWPAWAAACVALAGAMGALVAMREQRAAAPAVPVPSAAVAAVLPGATTRGDAARADPAAPTVPVPRPARDSAAAEKPKAVRAPAVAPGPAMENAPAAERAAAAPAPASAASPDAALRLQAVSERDGQPIAIVNDHLVRVGDEINGMRVLAIRATEVDIELQGRRTTLKF